MSAGAFVTSQTEGSNKPSIFTLVAAEALSRSIQPALEHLLRILAERYPSKCGQLWRFSDEIHLFLDFFLQRHYLEFYQSCFAENFYGLERIFSENLDKKSATRQSLILNVFLPYAKLKCDRAFEQARAENSRSKLARCFVLVYPYIHMTWEGTLLAFCLLYSAGKSDYHSPWNYLLKCRMQYAEIQKDFSLKDQSGGWLKSLGAHSVNGFATVLTTGLQFGAFFLQFLDWWYANKPISSMNLGTVTIIPPPAPISSEETELHNYIFKCPICHGKAENETLLPISGLVFCYRCIIQQLRTEGKCPVTNLPTNEEHLVRVYTSENE